MIGCVRGALTGFISQVTSFVAIMLSIFICRIFGELSASFILKLLPELAKMPAPDVVSSMLGHLLLFILVYLSINLLGTSIRTLAHTLHLGAFDRIAGSAMCALKYMMGLSIFINLWYLISPHSELFTSSRLFGGSLFRFVADMIPWLIDSKMIPTVTGAIKAIGA